MVNINCICHGNIKCSYNLNKHSMICDSPQIIKLSPTHKELQKDIQIETKDFLVIFGYIYSMNDKTMSNISVKLNKKISVNGKFEFIHICQTLSDFRGFFELMIPDYNCNLDYELLIDSGEINCTYSENKDIDTSTDGNDIDEVTYAQNNKINYSNYPTSTYYIGKKL